MRIDDILEAASPQARTTLEQKLGAYCLSQCQACRESLSGFSSITDTSTVQWLFLCDAHAPAVRSFIDPKYLPYVRRQKAYWQERIDILERALAIHERIERGRLWILEDEADRKSRGEAAMKLLRQSLAEREQMMDTQAITNDLSFARSCLTHWTGVEATSRTLARHA